MDSIGQAMLIGNFKALLLQVVAIFRSEAQRDSNTITTKSKTSTIMAIHMEVGLRWRVFYSWKSAVCSWSAACSSDNIFMMIKPYKMIKIFPFKYQAINFKKEVLSSLAKAVTKK